MVAIPPPVPQGPVGSYSMNSIDIQILQARDLKINRKIILYMFLIIVIETGIILYMKGWI